MPGPEATAEESDQGRGTLSGLVADPNLRKLFDYWRDRRQGRLIPSKDDIDPLDIGWALSRIFLLDYDSDEGFRYRLAGDDIARVFGRGNLKGLNLRDLVNPDRIEAIENIWRQVVDGRNVVCMKGMVYFGVDRIPIGERILLPLVDGGTDKVTGLLGMTVCEWVAGDVPEEVKLARYRSVPVAAIP